MRSKILVMVGLLGVAGLANATIVQCGTGQITLTTLLTYTGADGNGVNGCEFGDKVFTNFSQSGLGANVYATINNFAGGATTVFDLHDPNAFAVGFTLSYDVTIDSTQAPAAGPDAAFWRIVSISAGGQMNGVVGTATLVKSIQGAGAETVNFANGGNSVNPGPISVSATTVHVTDTFTQGGTVATILDLSNTFNQADTAGPEPGTMFLMGGALFGLGVVARKRRNGKKV